MTEAFKPNEKPKAGIGALVHEILRSFAFSAHCQYPTEQSFRAINDDRPQTKEK